MSSPPFLSVVVPSFEGRQMLPECLASLETQTYARDRFEVVVVDNGSTDGTAEWLAAAHPGVVVVREESNLGFAEGTNRGAAAARGELLVFLNNDAVAEPRFLEELAQPALASSQGVACVAGRILDWEREKVEFGGSGLNIFGFGFQRSSWQPGFAEARAGDALPFACGGAMLVRTEVFRHLGGFDPDYFAYYEDVDLGWRLWLAGHRVVYAPAAEVRHHRHGTGRRFSDRWRNYHWYRNTLQTLFKNSEETLLPRLLPLAFSVFLNRISSLYQAASQSWGAGDNERAAYYIECAVGGGEGINWILTHIDALLAKRRQVQGLRRVSDKVLGETFGLGVDFGPEAHFAENALALRLLPLVDLSGLMATERLEAEALGAAARVLDTLQSDLPRLQRDLQTLNAEATRLHQDLHARNLEAERLHRDLHARNLEVEQLRAQLSRAEGRLEAVLSSRSWRWTAPLRAVFPQPRENDPR